MSEPDFIIRVLNLVLAAVYFVYVWRLRHWWDGVPEAVRFMLLALTGMVAWAALTIVELIVLAVPHGPRTYLATPVLAWAVYGVWLKHKHWRESHANTQKRSNHNC